MWSRIPLFIAVVSLSISLSAQTLPEGDGKEIIANACNQCHELRYVTDSLRTQEQWQYIVSMMIGMGAQVHEDQVDIVVNYLAKHYGRHASPPATAGSDR